MAVEPETDMLKLRILGSRQVSHEDIGTVIAAAYAHNARDRSNPGHPVVISYCKTKKREPPHEARTQRLSHTCPSHVAKQSKEHGQREEKPELGLVDTPITLRQPDDP